MYFEKIKRIRRKLNAVAKSHGLLTNKLSIGDGPPELWLGMCTRLFPHFHFVCLTVGFFYDSSDVHLYN